MPECINVAQTNQVSEDELKGLEYNIRSMIEVTFGYHRSHKRTVLQEKYNKSGSKQAKNNLDKEKQREKEHKLLNKLVFDYVYDMTLTNYNNNVDPSALVEMIYGILEHKFGQAGKLWEHNARRIHDERKILEKHFALD